MSGHRTPPGPVRQAAIYLQGPAGRRPAAPTTGALLEAVAVRRVMSVRGFACVAGGAGSVPP